MAEGVDGVFPGNWQPYHQDRLSREPYFPNKLESGKVESGTDIEFSMP